VKDNEVSGLDHVVGQGRMGNYWDREVTIIKKKISNFSKCANRKNDLMWKKSSEMCDCDGKYRLQQLGM